MTMPRRKIVVVLVVLLLTALVWALSTLDLWQVFDALDGEGEVDVISIH